MSDKRFLFFHEFVTFPQVVVGKTKSGYPCVGGGIGRGALGVIAQQPLAAEDPGADFPTGGQMIFSPVLVNKDHTTLVYTLAMTGLLEEGGGPTHSSQKRDELGDFATVSRLQFLQLLAGHGGVDLGGRLTDELVGAFGGLDADVWRPAPSGTSSFPCTDCTSGSSLEKEFARAAEQAQVSWRTLHDAMVWADYLVPSPSPTYFFRTCNCETSQLGLHLRLYLVPQCVL